MISGGLARGGPILVAKISPESKLSPCMHHDQWGDYFWLGGTDFGCQNQSGETDFGCQNWSGGPFFRKNRSGGTTFGRGTDFGVTGQTSSKAMYSHFNRYCLTRRGFTKLPSTRSLVLAAAKATRPEVNNSSSSGRSYCRKLIVLPRLVSRIHPVPNETESKRL